MYGPSIQCPVSQKAVQHQTTFAENSSKSRDSIKFWIAAFVASLVSLPSQHISIYCKGFMFSSVYLPLFKIFNMIYIMYIYISNNVCIYIYTYLDIVPLHVIACSFMCRIAVLFTFMQQKNAKQMGLGKVSHGTSWRHSHPLRESKLHPLLSQAESKKGRESSGSRNEENTRS